MSPDLALYAGLAGAGVALIAVSFGLGRRANGHAVRRAKELGSRLEVEREQTARLRDEVASAKEALSRAEHELEDYRARVVEHFSGTSDRLRDLTLQYRALYEHLRDGAGNLCPEGSLKIEGPVPFGVPPGSPDEPGESLRAEEASETESELTEALAHDAEGDLDADLEPDPDAEPPARGTPPAA